MTRLMLKEVCDVFDGPHATPTKTEEGPIYLGINAITEDGRLNEKEFVHLSTEDYDKWTKRVVPKENDIVFSYEATLGRYAIIPKGFYGCLGRRLAIIRNKSDTINTKWLFYYFFSPEWKALIRRNTVKGSTVDRISVEEFPMYTIPAVQKKEQDKIASILSTIDEKINTNNRINDNLRQQLRTLYDYWFTQFDFPDENGMPYKAAGGNMRYSSRLKKSIPCNWDVTSLSESTTIATDGVNPNHYHGQIMEHYSIPAYDENYMPVFEKAAQIESGKYRVYPDSILVSKLNPKFKRLWDPMCLTENAICSTEFIVYRPINVEFRSFIYGVLDSDAFYAHMVQNAVSSTGSRKRIQPEVSSRFLFPVPKDPTVLRAFCRISTPLLENRNRIIKENQQLVAFREWLLPMLMNGQVTVAD